jgi:rhodanese-related sulfurtransferase
MSHNKIGFYQLSNLVENRVPFLFLNLSTNIADWFTLMAKMHVEVWQVMLSESQIEAELHQRQIPKDFAIVILCPDGKQSEKIAADLEKKGYTNVYLIDGGYQQMVTDKS